MDIQKDITILYPLCPSHSGSTLLSLMIGSQANIFNAGELFLFSDRPNHLIQKIEENCSCNNRKKEECPYWSTVDNLLQSKYNLNLNQLNVESGDCDLLKLHNTYLFDAIAHVSKCRVIVDASKVVSRFLQLREAGFNIIPIVFLRNPCATVYSWTKRNYDWQQVANYYPDYYQEVAKEIPDRKYLRVTYESFINEPIAYLRKILEHVDLDQSEITLDWSMSDIHILKGNAVKYQKDSKLKVSEEWKSSFTLKQKVLINLKAFPTLIDSYWLFFLWSRLLRLFRWR